MKGKPVPPAKQHVKYVPAGFVQSHSTAIGYLLWLIGFTGAHRFYFGKPVSGTIWFFTCGLLGVGWIIDLFLIPSMNREAAHEYIPGSIDYTVAWLLLMFLGVFGLHRFYQGKIFTGLLYLLTGALFFLGYIYDVLTLNEQISEEHEHEVREMPHQMAW